MNMPIELKQMIEATGTPIDIVDVERNEHYVLIPAAVYDRIAALLDQQDVREMQQGIAKVFGPAGWDEPEMDIYNDLDPRQ